MHRYRLTSTRDSSRKYGVCEICGKHVIEVFIQAEEKMFFIGKEEHWTHVNLLFGHEKCLIKTRK